MKPIVEEVYPDGTFITFAGYKQHKPLQGQIIVMWHLNNPIPKALELFETSLTYYPNAIYLVNSKELYNNVIQLYDKVYFLPRFIDPEALPKPNENKTNESLWFGNAWEHHKDKFERYKKEVSETEWISKGKYKSETVNRERTLEVVNNTKKVWAIGLCAMEAKHLGCEVYEYDGKEYEVIYPQQVMEMLRKILLTEKSLKHDIVREHD